MGQKLVEHAGAVIPSPVLEYVTPDMARDWLKSYNGENRAVRARWVAAIAGEITAGRWMVTGDPIRFDETGNLIDGQHRLAAVVRSNTAVPVFVIRGLPTNVRDVIDTGIVRSATDAIKFAGFKNASQVAAVARIGIMREIGLLRSAHDSRPLKVTNAAVMEWVGAHEDVAPVVDRVKNPARRLQARSVAAFTHEMWVYAVIDPVAAAEFESSLVESRTDGHGDPRFTLLRFFQMSGQGRAGVRDTPVSETMFVTRRAWNAWRRGERLDRMMTVSKSGTAGIEIPDPI